MRVETASLIDRGWSARVRNRRRLGQQAGTERWPPRWPLIAPRPLYVASAAEDLGSDPKGEFLSAVSASRVYQLFGKKGLGTAQMPAVDQPIMHDIGYHIRTGKHDVTEFDWQQYIAFADMHWGISK